MNKTLIKDNQGLAHLGAILLIGVVLAVAGFAGYRVFTKSDTKSSQSSSGSETSGGQTSSDVIWTPGGDKWIAQGGTPPECSGKPEFQMPADINAVTRVLYPGQQRSTGYKTHGGFLFENAANSAVDVSIPIDSHLIKASRYIEMGEVQYFLVFSVPCGYAYRFDHLRTLTPKFQAIMDKLPEPKVDDSRTTEISPAVKFSKGEKVATAVGFGSPVGMDFGIYDVRQQNAVSKEASYIAKHESEKEFAYYGVCFLDYMGADSAKLAALPPADSAAGKTSDYC